MSKSSKFLTSVLGSQGTKALFAAADRQPELENAITPRAVLSWLDITNEFDDLIPGQSVALTFQKNEAGFTGFIKKNDSIQGFEDISVYRLAAIVSACLGIKPQEIDEDADLKNLGKSIDILVRFESLKKAEAMGAAAAPQGVIEVQGPIPPTPKQPKKKKPKLPKPTGTLKVTQTSISTTPPATPAPAQPGVAQAVLKSEPKDCRSCGLSHMRDGIFVGCMCIRSFGDQLSLVKSEDGYVLETKGLSIEELEVVGESLNLQKTSWNVKNRRLFQYDPDTDKPLTSKFEEGGKVRLLPSQVEARRRRFAQSIGLMPAKSGDYYGGNFPTAKGNKIPYGGQFGIEHETAHAAMVPKGKTIRAYQDQLSDNSKLELDRSGNGFDNLEEHDEALHAENVANQLERHIDRRAGVDPNKFASKFRNEMQAVESDDDPGIYEEKGPQKKLVPHQNIREDAKYYANRLDEGARFNNRGRLEEPKGIDAKINERAKRVKLPGRK